LITGTRQEEGEVWLEAGAMQGQELIAGVGGRFREKIHSEVITAKVGI